ncbi:MAG: FAD:protein FMN transferase, partial [Candidatus Hydrogenedentes bacterium]|nr:FAD:protein FMN transferase [Candidatus Hydrogenedentota bacterium]
ASRAAFDEIDRTEQYLSRFIESSDISRLNLLGSTEPVRVSVDTFDCLSVAVREYRATDGAFDVTARRDTISPGTDCLELDRQEMTVRFKVAGARIDLGGIGKGFALDKAAELIDDWRDESMGIGPVFLHGGGSTVLAVGAPPGKKGWVVRVGYGTDDGDGARNIKIKDRALSASGSAVKGAHIIDPATGKPAAVRVRDWVSIDGKTEYAAATADALSTAFMIMPTETIEQYCANHPGTWTMLLQGTPDEKKVAQFGTLPIL